MKGFNKCKIKYLLTFILCFTMGFGLLAPANVGHAQGNATEELGSLSAYNEDIFESYEDAQAASKAAMEAAGEPAVDSEAIYDEALMVDAPSFSNVTAATKYVREQMVNRNALVSFYINKGGYSYEQVFDIVMDDVFNETANPKEGDYLHWNWSSVDVDAYMAGNQYYFIFYFEYLSTANQEKAIDAKVKDLLNNEFAGWEDTHDFYKIFAVEYWLQENADYDYNFRSGCFSTYSALITGSTVCQGYATAVYRLLREMEVSTRVVTSETMYDEDGYAISGHAWNIAQVGRYYYNVDVTWDDSNGDYYYFLSCPTTFEDDMDHIREYPYYTDEFYAQYPMGTEDYYIEDHEDEISVRYKTHVQSYGWQSYVYDGTMSGTSGEAKRLEGIQIKLGNNEKGYDLGLEYRTHIQKYGWEKEWRTDDEFSGTSGEAKRLEAIQIRLTGADSDKYDIWYRVHAQSYGWLGWAKNGQEAGTAGQGKRLEGIEIIVLPKGEYPSEGVIGYSYVDYGMKSKSNDAAYGLVNYKTHVQTYGWQGYVYDGSISGTSGKSKRLEGINISLGNTGYEGGIRYTTHVQTYGWQGDKDKPETWKKDGEMAGTSGEAKRLEGIRIQLYGEVAEHYDVYYRVHAQSFGWLDWAKNGADAGTAGLAKRLEAIQIVLVPKGSTPPGSTSRPFVSK